VIESLLIHTKQSGSPDRSNVVTVRLSFPSTIVTVLAMAPVVWAIAWANKERSQRSVRFVRETMDRVWPSAQEKKQRSAPEANSEA
jgi:hypothetical protein